jgi:hypothetical protein
MNVFIGPIQRLNRRRLQLQIEEELQFHLELLTAEHSRQNIPWDQAQAAALRRFGDVEKIRDECVRIASRNHPVVLAFKWFLGFVFVTGVLVRVFGTDYHVTRIGTGLMAVAILSRVLLYVRGMTPSTFVKAHHDSAPLKLNDS